ncbi:hypothetical protein Pmani_031917 [Petrolisthes manimaculis]|uniref:Uncharacterized protein n=1 Tax=Petrolisthes manimaculis TaxID=1843537 RepID=A0AAE1NSS0_9EUCA|nr:hypothetical protein Pmani_031917 [Petrolisthes manimaculis]
MYVFIIKVGDGEIHEHSEAAATTSDEAEHARRRRDSPRWRTHDCTTLDCKCANSGSIDWSEKRSVYLEAVEVEDGVSIFREGIAACVMAHVIAVSE